MIISKAERLPLYSVARKALSDYSIQDIENGVMDYCLSAYGRNPLFLDNRNAVRIASILERVGLPTDLEIITEFFESLLEENNKDENGIVFTPEYIAKYIANSAFSRAAIDVETASIIDPGCGCGIFLIAAAEYILSNSSKPIDSIIEENIYGIDIDKDNVRRCKLIMQLLSAKHGGCYQSIKSNIVCMDSLKNNWASSFGVDSFDFIVGNPPYVNPHDMNKETIQFLKRNFRTTKSGVFNIFYAFIEKGMTELREEGVLSFIVPNNFLTIKSALELREFLQSNRYVNGILDFGDNMIFKPVRTYNCIIYLSRKTNSFFDYCVLPKSDNIEKSLPTASFGVMGIDLLDKTGWKLVDEKTYRNLRRIENQLVSIKDFIRTGIATLRDSVYLVDSDEVGYYKLLDGKKYDLEPDLIKPIYKVPELKIKGTIEDAKRYIIFPYVKSKTGYTLIEESDFAKRYPKTYTCLLMQKEELNKRDKGRVIPQGWYAYGRTQGLNKYGKKLLFPTFASEPKFMLVNDEDALFCNGYAIFENDVYDLDILIKVLNSRLMSYYVANTSYSIEGGYYCYQKKYVERFSLPWFSEEELSFIRRASKTELDEFLWNLYKLE